MSRYSNITSSASSIIAQYPRSKEMVNAILAEQSSSKSEMEEALAIKKIIVNRSALSSVDAHYRGALEAIRQLAFDADPDLNFPPFPPEMLHPVKFPRSGMRPLSGGNSEELINRAEIWLKSHRNEKLSGLVGAWRSGKKCGICMGWIRAFMARHTS